MRPANDPGGRGRASAAGIPGRHIARQLGRIQARQLRQALADHGAEGRGLDLGNEGLRLGEEPGTPLLGTHVHLRGDLGHQELGERLRFGQRPEKRLLADPAHEGIGSSSGGRNRKATDLPSASTGSDTSSAFQAARRPAASPSKQYTTLSASRRSLATCIGVVAVPRVATAFSHAVLGERHHVHVALDHDDEVGVADGAPRLPQPVELAPLLEERRFPGEFRYLGSPSPITRPPKPITLPRESRMGNITRPRNLS